MSKINNKTELYSVLDDMRDMAWELQYAVNVNSLDRLDDDTAIYVTIKSLEIQIGLLKLLINRRYDYLEGTDPLA